MTGRQVIEAYLAAARGLGVTAQVRLHEDRREQMVAQAGVVETYATSRTAAVAVVVRPGGGIGMASAPTSADPGSVLADALATVHRAGPAVLAGPAIQGPDRVPRCTLGALAGEVARCTRTGRGLRAELRAEQLRRLVLVAGSDGASGGYRTSTASLLYRVTSPTGAAGTGGHLDRTDHGPDAWHLLRRFPDHVQRPCLTVVRAPDLPAGRPLPSRVVFDGTVAARLLALFARGLAADAVAQGRSALGGRLGEVVAAPAVTIVDDPTAREAPLFAAFDDEGSPAARRRLVDGGVLAGYLGGRASAEAVPGTRRGNAWQAGPATAPRPAPGNLWIEPGREVVPTPGPVLRVVQAHGMHLANDITGEFSMGVTAVLEDGPRLAVARDTTVAGNVFDAFHRVRVVGAALGWAGGGTSFCGAPDLLVRDGLSTGR